MFLLIIRTFTKSFSVYDEKYEDEGSNPSTSTPIIKFGGNWNRFVWK